MLNLKAGNPGKFRGKYLQALQSIQRVERARCHFDDAVLVQVEILEARQTAERTGLDAPELVLVQEYRVQVGQTGECVRWDLADVVVPEVAGRRGDKW